MIQYDCTKFPTAKGIKSALVVGQNAWRDVANRNVGPFFATNDPHSGRPLNTAELDPTALKLISSIPADLVVADIECYQLWQGGVGDALTGLHWNRHFGEKLRAALGPEKLTSIYGFPTNWAPVVLGDRRTFVRQLLANAEILDVFDRLSPQFYVTGNLPTVLKLIGIYAELGRSIGILDRLVPFICARDYGKTGTGWLELDQWKRLLDATVSFGGRVNWLEQDTPEPMPSQHRRVFEEAKS